jgi:Uma2 family endonuclease
VIPGVLSFDSVMTDTGRARLPYTYEAYAALPSDGRRWELIDGDLEVNPAPSPRHQTVSRRLQFELMKQLEEPSLAQVFNAPIDVILSDTDVLQPDLAIVEASREHLITDRGIEGPPNIVVEVLSPGTRVLDRRVKSITYFRFQVPEYWLVDPNVGGIELYRPGEDRYDLAQRFDRASTLVTPSFPEVSVALAKVFR